MAGTTNRRETNAISDNYQVATTTVANHYAKQTEQSQNYRCGVPTIRNKPKHYLWGMLRIIGGKTARRGQWPWQVAILNRFKVSMTHAGVMKLFCNTLMDINI